MTRVRNFVINAAVQTTLFVAISHQTTAQKTDTAYIISSTDKQYTATPPSLSNNPFYDIIRPNKPGFRPTAFYSSDDRIFLGLHYIAFSRNWNPDSSGRKHKVYSNYSINQKAFSIGYQGIIHNIIRDWSLFVDVNYDWIKWTNFYGLGNQTVQETDNRDFYRMRSREASITAGIQRKIGKQSRLTISPFFQRVHLINDADRFLANNSASGFKLVDYQAKNFAGIYSLLQLQRLDNLLLPTKGVIVTGSIGHVRNVNEPKFFNNYSIYTRLFFPFLNRFVFSTENGASTIAGEPEFYQMNSIGGNSLRGYRRDRFWGETVFHNNNELQYLFNVRKLINGKMGFLAFFDQGRVWKQGENSSLWHNGYGGGIILAPYNKLYLSVQYGISNERKGFHFEFRRSL